MFKPALFALFISFTANCLAQSQEERLAMQYYEQEQYAQALPYFTDLFEHNPEIRNFYEHYLHCLLELKEFDKASRVVKKRQKKEPAVWQYKVDEGYVLEKEGKTDQAGRQYSDVVKSLGSDLTAYYDAAEAFRNRNRYDFAIKVFEKGEDEFEGFTDFGSQLATLYMQTGNRARGIEKYVDMVLNSGLPPEQAKTLFEMNMTDSMDLAILRTVLLKHIQESPDSYALTDLLKWTFVKQKDWNAAFVQTRALDKRLHEQGGRMIELGEMCMSNEAWDVAEKCFVYVKELGPGKDWYYPAVAGLLETRYMMAVSGTATNETLLALKSDFSAYIDELGYNERSWRIVQKLAELETRYLHEPDKAVDLLETFVNTPGIRPSVKAEAKLELGDAYVMDGDVWSSELLYAQVEKDYTEDALGQEAKYKRARLSYYRGDFEWAQIQLNVLKGATTQLISNNAIELSLKISENLGIDSNYHALGLYANAELLLEQNRLNEAEMLLDSIIELYPGHSLSDDILYTRAGIREKQGRFSDAIALYETLTIAYSFDLLADNAWYRMGILYETALNQPEKAQECFRKIIIDFPGSLLTTDARRHFRKLRGDDI